ncbi:alpha/beta fold hydrolase [Geobacter pickeringii]|uniref:alpha/beta fold hydrolase n=1 Tax=Geobacter pickeringii TaxID=345632 RepID=UPI00068BB1E3|nr:alpha/beta hydrolase [Geobacter pickeringii]
MTVPRSPSPTGSLSADRFFTHSPGTVIRYRLHGTGPQPVLFVHGFAAALTTWDDIVPLFPPHRFTLYLMDLKGFGFSSKPRRGSYAPEEQAAVLLSFMEAVAVDGAVLVGHSLGGGIALLALLRAMTEGRARLVSRLILLDCAAYPQRLPRFMRWLKIPLIGRLGMALLPLRTLVLASLRAVFHDERAITPERIRRYEGCFGRSGMARVLIRTVQELDRDGYQGVVARFREIAVPTLIIWGSEDRIIRLANGKRLQREIPGARLAIIPECGHNPHEERPRETYGAIADFLGGDEKETAER